MLFPFNLQVVQFLQWGRQCQGDLLFPVWVHHKTQIYLSKMMFYKTHQDRYLFVKLTVAPADPGGPGGPTGPVAP